MGLVALAGARKHSDYAVTDLARGTVLMLIARVFLLVSGFGVSIILARTLGPAGFGIYGVVISFLVWFERGVAGGIPRATATLLAQYPDQRSVIAQSTRVLLVSLMIPIFGVIWVLAPQLANYLGSESATTIIRVAALNLPAMALFFSYESMFNGLRIFGAQSMLLVAQAATKLIGVVALIFLGTTVVAAMGVHVGATLVAVAGAAYLFRIGPAKASVGVIKKMVKLALPLGLYLFALLVLMNLSLWQLKGSPQHDPDEVGIYVAGLNLTRILMMVPATVSVVLYASLIRALAQQDYALARKYTQGALRFAVVLLVPACVLLSVDAQAVMTLLFGERYSAGGPVLVFLCVAFAMVALLDVLLNSLMACGSRAWSALLLVGLAPVLYVLNTWWIPTAGGVGAAAASAVVLSIGALTSLVLVHRRLGPPLVVKTLLRVVGAGLVVGTLSATLPAEGLVLIVKLGLLGILYLGLLFLSGELTGQDAKPFALWKPAQRQ